MIAPDKPETHILWPTAQGEVSAFRLSDLAKGVGLTEQQFLDESASNDDFLADATRNVDPFDREFAPEGGSEESAFHNLKLRLPGALLSLRRENPSEVLQSNYFREMKMVQKTDIRPIAGNPKLFIEDLGYDIREDSQQPGLWIWTAPTDGYDISFNTAEEALAGAWVDAVWQTMGINNLSSEQWDAMSFDEQKVSVLRALSDEGDDVQDVIDDVLERSEKYGFKPDEDMVRGAVEGSACLLNIELSEEQIADACERIINPEDTSSERPLG